MQYVNAINDTYLILVRELMRKMLGVIMIMMLKTIEVITQHKGGRGGGPVGVQLPSGSEELLKREVLRVTSLS